MKIETAKQMLRRLWNGKKESGLTNRQIRIIILAIFPTREGDLDAYFNNVQGYLTLAATRTRLGVDATKFATFNGLMGGPRLPTGTPPNTNSTPHTWNYVYPLEKDYTTKTKPLVDEKDELIVSIKAAIRDVYSNIPDANLLPVDITTTHIVPKANHADPTPEPEEIVITVGITLTPLGGGKMEAVFTTPTGAIAMPFLGVTIQIAYSIIPINATPPVPSPATSGACAVHDVISTARHIFDLGETAIGMKMVLFARYVYIKHPKKSGGYAESVSKTIA